MNQKTTLRIHFETDAKVTNLWVVVFIYFILLWAITFWIWSFSIQQFHFVDCLISFHIHRCKKYFAVLILLWHKWLTIFTSVIFVGGLEAQLSTEMEEINVLEDLHLDHMTLWISAHC